MTTMTATTSIPVQQAASAQVLTRQHPDMVLQQASSQPLRSQHPSQPTQIKSQPAQPPQNKPNLPQQSQNKTQPAQPPQDKPRPTQAPQTQPQRQLQTRSQPAQPPQKKPHLPSSMSVPRTPLRREGFPRTASDRTPHTIELGERELAAQLSAAVAQVTRLDRDFAQFRAGASRKLAAALEENRQLKRRLAELGEGQQKPTERKLSVERLREAGVVRVERPSKRSLRPIRRKEGVEKVENVKEERRSMRMARSFSRKLSTCF